MIEVYDPMKLYAIFIENAAERAKLCEYDVDNSAEMYAVYENLCSTLFDVLEMLKECRDELLDDALTNGYESEYVRLEELKKVKRVVDVEKLFENRPDLYEELAFVEARAAQKILGKLFIRDKVREFEGLDRTAFEAVNVTDLKKRLSPADFPKYVIEKEEPAGYTAEGVY